MRNHIAEPATADVSKPTTNPKPPTRARRTRKNLTPIKSTAATVADDWVVTGKELRKRIPLDRSTIWRMIRDGRFPAPIQLTPGRVGWRWSAIAAWLAEREERPVESRLYFGRAAESGE